MSETTQTENGEVVKTEKQLKAEEKKRQKLEKLALKIQKEEQQKAKSEVAINVDHNKYVAVNR